MGPAKHDVVIRGTDRNRVDPRRRRRRALQRHHGARRRRRGREPDRPRLRHRRVVFTPPKDMPTQLNGWRASFVTAANNGLHGIEALRSRGGTIDHALASGHGVAGFRIGNCRPCDSLVTDSVAERGMAGFEGSRLRRQRRRRALVLPREPRRRAAGLGRRGEALPPAGHDGGRQRDRGQRQRGWRQGAARASASASSCAAGAATGWRATSSPVTPVPAFCSPPPTRRPRPRTACRATSCRTTASTSRWRRAPGSARRRARASPRTISARRCRATSRRCCRCQSDVPLRVADPALPIAPPGADWRNVRLPAPQRSMPDANTSKPQPAKRPGRIDVARVGVPGQG